MINIRGHLGNILDNLNRADALPELTPKERGRYVYLTCPSCHQTTAYISQQGYYIHCNRKNNCGYVKGLVEYISERDKISEEDAVRTLAAITNTQLPELSEEDKEKYKEFRERERLFSDILSIAKYGIWLDIAAPVRDYLNKRGYFDDEIITMDFGFLPIISELKKRLKDNGHSYLLVEETLKSFNHNNPLLIPVYNPFGALDGFIARAVNSDTTPKYLYSKELERGSYFFNFNESKREETLIIVEGIIDALLLTQRGIKGAVACGGDSPTETQISNAIKYGKVKNVILCLDHDSAGIKGTERAIELLKEKDIHVYVANTSPYKDPDELIKAESLESFKEVIKQAASQMKWIAKRIISKYDTATDIGREGALNELLKLDNDITDPVESEYIISAITDNLGYSRNVLADKILTYHEKRTKEKQAVAYRELLKNALQLEKDCKFEELEKTLSNGVAKVRAIAVSNIVTPYPTQKAVEDIQNRREGLETGYTDIDKFVTIPNGAMTLVAGRPSHCKTTLLLNLMLNMVKKYPDKSFYFFSYEESKTALYVKLINILSETIVSKGLEFKNSQQLEYYIKGAQTVHQTINNALVAYENYVKNGRLWLVDKALSVDLLAGTLENLTYDYNMGGVFIDYAQRIKYNGKYESERVKIARISETLRETATRLDIPLIVGTQLNRENAKQKPQLDNLKEAGNLEEDANVVLGLYNWKTAIDKEKADEEIKNGQTKRNKLKNCKGEDVKIDPRAIDFEVHILKNRNGAINETALLSFDAPILKIKEAGVKSEEVPF